MLQVRSTKKYMSSVFYVTSRDLITKHLHVGYFSDIVYYQLNVLDESIDNPYVVSRRLNFVGFRSMFHYLVIHFDIPLVGY